MSSRHRPKPRALQPVRRHLAPMQPTFIRRLLRLKPGQLAAGLIAALVVCSLVASTLGTVVFDAARGGSDDVAENDADQVDQAIQDQRDRLEDNPDDTGAMGLLASLLASDGQIAEANRWYEEVLTRNPNDVTVRLNFGRQLASNDRPADARLQFQRVIEIAQQPVDRATAHFELGRLAEQAAPPRLDEAISEYQSTVSEGADAFVAEQARDRLAELLGTPVASPIAA